MKKLEPIPQGCGADRNRIDGVVVVPNEQDLQSDETKKQIANYLKSNGITNKNIIAVHLSDVKLR